MEDAMPFIGFDRDSGLLYEGEYPFVQAVWPIPQTAPARIVSASASDLSPPPQLSLEGTTRLFREDTFDPVSRIRRGRFYDASTWQSVEVFPHPYRPTEVNDAKMGTGTISKQLLVFQPAHMPELATHEQHLAIIGSGEHFSLWLILAVENTTSNERSVWLRARQSYGALPELKPKAIPTKSRAILQDAINKLRDDVFRSGIDSVVDRAREAANVAFSAYMQSHRLAKSGLELFALLEIHDKAPANKKKLLAASAANIARLFHSRGKGSQKRAATVPSVVRARRRTSRCVRWDDSVRIWLGRMAIVI
jgi:hypothetical protein